ncbi:MAG: heparinase II/III family protein [Cypionkella sp.]|uniref:heparinase II/III family protein n=1 Tax=Cypionkella sp. TaxID=2811411 RepID=UPI002AB95793|nr:heparinase II/III family protein [Cypionkella sp.]MDZ4309639.1 heparinase II/III family protein [Cypionkella sp.]
MIGYHLKRAARNRFVKYFPAVYSGYIDRIAARVPPLQRAGDSVTELEMLRQVAVFYHDEYHEHIDDAMRGCFTFFGQSVDFGGPDKIDWHHELEAEKDLHLWRMKLGHMGFSCAMLISGDDKHHAALGKMIQSYGTRARFDRSGCFSSYWFPYSVSHRILSLLSGYLIARESRFLPPAFCQQIEAFLCWNVGFVLANIEHELKNNHVERNLAALCLYYNHAESISPELARHLDREVAGVIRACILEDGLLAERSAMYQGLSVMALQVFSATSFLSPGTRSLAEERLGKAERAWAVMTHPDGGIALFNDSWFGEVPEAREVIDMPALAPVEMLPAAGYARLSDGNVFALMDAGPIGPSWNPGHGHADFLSLEVDLWKHRFIVDPGTFQYSTGRRRAFERAAQSHNGPTCDELVPVEYHGCFRVGRMVAAQFVPNAQGGGRAVSGELRLAQGLVQRKVHLLGSGAGLSICDHWSEGLSDGVVRLLIPEQWKLLGVDGEEARFRCICSPGETRDAVIQVGHGWIESCEPGQWACHYLQSLAAHNIVLRPRENAKSGAQLSWRIETR